MEAEGENPDYSLARQLEAENRRCDLGRVVMKYRARGFYSSSWRSRADDFMEFYSTFLGIARLPFFIKRFTT